MDEYAPFARYYDPLLSRALRPVFDSVTAELTQRRSRAMVDLCCGTGLLAERALARGLAVVGVDISAAMLLVARAKRPGAKYLFCDAANVRLPDGQFDAACITFALHEKKRDTALAILAEAQRLVRSGGRVVVADYRHPRRRSLLSGAAIRVVERLAGQDHHAHFMEFMEAGGARKMLDEAGMTDAERITAHMNGWVGVYGFTKGAR